MLLLELIGLALLLTIWQLIKSDEEALNSTNLFLKITIGSMIVATSLLVFADLLDFILDITG